MYAGPRTLVRRGRRGKFPIRAVVGSEESWLNILLYACVLLVMRGREECDNDLPALLRRLEGRSGGGGATNEL